MEIETINKAILEAKEFIARAEKITNNCEGYSSRFGVAWGTKDASSLKRKSMDLTRILADLRQNK